MHMLAQVPLFVLLVLMSGLLCAPAPKIFRTGVFHQASGATGVNVGANGKATSNGGVTNGTAYGKLGLSASGEVLGGVFVQNDDKITEAAGEYHASGGGWVKPTFRGQIGKNADGKPILGGNTKWRSGGEISGAGSAGIFTDEDALHTFNGVHNRVADDILSEIDDDDDD